MRSVVDVPVELVVDDLILPERKCARRDENGDEEQQSDRALQMSLHGCRGVLSRGWGMGEKARRNITCSSAFSPTPHPPLPTLYSVNTYLVADVSWGTKMPTSCVSIARRF